MASLPLWLMAGNGADYTVLLRHGSLADCPCFRIPSLTATGPACELNFIPALPHPSSPLPANRNYPIHPTR